MPNRAKFQIDLGANQEAFELMENLDKYRRLLGWSRKRMYLIGAAHIISNNKDNPDLILAITDYLEGKFDG